MGDGVVPAGVEETARLVGGYVWAERTLFEVVGRWAVDAAELGGQAAPDAVFFATRSRRHGRCAELLADCLPRLAQLPAGGLVECPEPWRELFGGLDQLPPPDRRAVLVGTVLPALVSCFSDHLGRATPLSDGPVVAGLRQVVADHAGALDTGWQQT